MKFDEAFGKVLENMPPENMPKGDDNIPKILAFLWSMIAVSGKILDDIAYIDNNKNIISIPLQKSSTEKKPKNKTAKDKKEENKSSEKVEDNNGESGTESN